MARRRSNGLGSQSVAHGRKADYHRNSAIHAAGRGYTALRAGNCERALHELLSAKLYAGEFIAHSESIGKSRRPMADEAVTSTIELAVAFKRRCQVVPTGTLHGRRR